ncbi:MAG: hypothetical protein E6J87_06180 [Deltaproteobacteria bacterium]|nr:MAG: hypothetical protein E6J87_06180 [Deltaproteobacteria bacterium]
MDPTLVSLARGLPHAALDGLFEALAKIQTERQQRGRALAEPENVSGVGADARGVRANVSDDHHYVTRWAWSEEGAQSLCSCAAARACEHAFALGLLLLVAARRAGRWDHARWSKLASPALAAEPAGRESGDPPQGPGARLDASRHEHAVEALAQWADRGQAAPRRLRAVLDLEPGTLGALLTLEVRVTGAGLDDAPRTRRQLEQLSGELKRQPLLLAPPEARLLRALTSPEFVGPDASGRGSLPGGTRIELSSERMQALLDRVPESPHFTWSPGLPQALAERAGVSPGARASLHTEEVRVVPVCDSSVEPPRLELSLEWPDGSTRPLSEAGGRFVRIVDEPPRDVVKLLQEGGLALQQSDGAVLEKLSRSFPVVRSALRRLTRVHDVDVIACFELAAEDWLRVRVFAAARASGWAPGALAPEGAVFEYRPALGWMRLDAGDRVSGGMESVGDPAREGEPGAKPEPPAGAAGGWDQGSATRIRNRCRRRSRAAVVRAPRSRARGAHRRVGGVAAAGGSLGEEEARAARAARRAERLVAAPHAARAGVARRLVGCEAAGDPLVRRRRRGRALSHAARRPQDPRRLERHGLVHGVRGVAGGGALAP